MQVPAPFGVKIHLKKKVQTTGGILGKYKRTFRGYGVGPVSITRVAGIVLQLVGLDGSLFFLYFCVILCFKGGRASARGKLAALYSCPADYIYLFERDSQKSATLRRIGRFLCIMRRVISVVEGSCTASESATDTS